MAGIVWSSDNGRMCPDCGKPKDICICSKSDKARQSADGKVRIMRDKKGRGGKVVTVIEGIPLGGKDLKSFAKSLKKKCGAGGTIKDGTVEIQGDNIEKLFPILEKKGWNVVRVGG